MDRKAFLGAFGLGALTARLRGDAGSSVAEGPESEAVPVGEANRSHITIHLDPAEFDWSALRGDSGTAMIAGLWMSLP